MPTRMMCSSDDALGKDVFYGYRNEIKAYIVREGVTMSEVVDRLAYVYDWSVTFQICQASFAAVLCDIRRPSSLQMYWAMTLSGRNVNEVITAKSVMRKRGKCLWFEEDIWEKFMVMCA